MSKIIKQQILETAGSLFAKEGMESISIRVIAKKMGIAPSLIYYYFKNQEELLALMFDHLNHQLGRKRAQLPAADNARDMLRQRLAFQIDHQAIIVAVLKYYLKSRKTFPKFKDGFLPDKSSLHIEEVLEFGLQTGEFVSTDVEGDAKFITHAINGYLLEFYPHSPTSAEKNILIEQMFSFISRGLSKQHSGVTKKNF